MRAHIKKFVMVKENVTPMQLLASHRRFWEYIKDKALRVIEEDKTEYIVADEEGEQYRLRKEFAEVIQKGALVG